MKDITHFELLTFLIVFQFSGSIVSLIIHNRRDTPNTTEMNSTSSNIIFVGLPAAELNMTKKDDYMCSIHSLKSKSAGSGDIDERVPTSYIIRLEYVFDKSVVHHSLLYGCTGTSEFFSSGQVRNCHSKGHGQICKGRKQIPVGISDMNRNSNSSQFPSDTAYGIGSEFGIMFLLLEVHFGEAHKDPLASYGIQIHTTTDRPKFLAGMLAMAGAGFQIPPGREKYSIDVNCQPEISLSIYPYAYWVHTHRLGRVVSGYKIDKKSGAVREIARWSHLWPQPVIMASSAPRVTDSRPIHPGDFLAAKCTYNSSTETIPAKWGSRKDVDEMCDLFIFYYTESRNMKDLSITCVNQRSLLITKMLPKTADSLEGLQDPRLSQESHTITSTRNISRINKNPMSAKINNVRQTSSLICHMYSQLDIKSCPFQ